MRVGSMVFVKEQSPWCCCPPAFNNEDKTGYSYCPKNAYENTVGPWAAKLTSIRPFQAERRRRQIVSLLPGHGRA